MKKLYKMKIELEFWVTADNSDIAHERGNHVTKAIEPVFLGLPHLHYRSLALETIGWREQGEEEFGKLPG